MYVFILYFLLSVGADLSCLKKMFTYICDITIVVPLYLLNFPHGACYSKPFRKVSLVQRSLCIINDALALLCHLTDCTCIVHVQSEAGLFSPLICSEIHIFLFVFGTLN